MNKLDILEQSIQEDLQTIDRPFGGWSDKKIAIIGAGMAGLSAAFQLYLVGLGNVVLFDENSAGEEGPWVTYARMRTLRSGKELAGPALDFPKLTFKSWFIAQNGETAWEALGKIPNQMWMHYLSWFRSVLKFRVRNGIKIESLPYDKGFLIDGELFDKVILATGRSGYGGVRIPEWVHELPREKWAHTTEEIDFTKLQDKKILTIGAGASAFDASAVAIEKGARQVDLLCRRGDPGCINKLGYMVYPGFLEGFYYLPAHMKCEFTNVSVEGGAVPPHEAIDRIKEYPNFRLIQEGDPKDYDFIILGTGFDIDGAAQPELASYVNEIKLWDDVLTEDEKIKYPFAPPFPFLGAHFQFLPKPEADAPALKHLYCFNWGARMSHGIISGDIPGIGWGARRLALGLSADLFIENVDFYYNQIEKFDTAEFNPACLKH